MLTDTDTTEYGQIFVLLSVIIYVSNVIIYVNLKNDVYLNNSFDFQVVFDNLLATYSDMYIRGGRHVCCYTVRQKVHTLVTPF